MCNHRECAKLPVAPALLTTFSVEQLVERMLKILF